MRGRGRLPVDAARSADGSGGRVGEFDAGQAGESATRRCSVWRPSGWPGGSRGAAGRPPVSGVRRRGRGSRPAGAALRRRCAGGRRRRRPWRRPPRGPRHRPLPAGGPPPRRTRRARRGRPGQAARARTVPRTGRGSRPAVPAPAALRVGWRRPWLAGGRPSRRRRAHPRPAASRRTAARHAHAARACRSTSASRRGVGRWRAGTPRPRSMRAARADAQAGALGHGRRPGGVRRGPAGPDGPRQRPPGCAPAHRRPPGAGWPASLGAAGRRGVGRHRGARNSAAPPAR